MPTNSKEYWNAYAKAHRTVKTLRDKVLRTQARRIMIKKWLVKVGDGKEVDHVHWTKNWNHPSNLRVISRLKNRRLGQKKATISQLKNNGKL